MRLLPRTAALGPALLLLAGGCGDDEEAFDREECIDSAVEFLNSLDPDELLEIEEDEFSDQAREAVGDECYSVVDADLTDAEAADLLDRLDPELLELLGASANEQFDEVGDSIAEP